MTIWVVEGRYMRKKWRFCEAFATEAEAVFHAQRMTQALYPVWKYCVQEYKATSRLPQMFKYVKGNARQKQGGESQ